MSEENNNTDDILNAMLDEEMSKQTKTDKYKIDTDELFNLLREYLNDFILIGYNIDHERICISHSETESSSDALETLASRLLDNMFKV